MPTDVGADYFITLALWGVSLWVLVARAWGRRPVAGLALAYWFNMAIIHLFGGFLPLLPWYWNPHRADTLRGFLLTGYAMAALLIGHMLYRPRAVRAGTPRSAPLITERWTQQLGLTCLLVGLVSYFLLGFLLGDIPSSTSIVSNGLYLATAGCCLLWGTAYRAGRRREAWLWMSLFLLFPVLTVILWGFLGFGVAAVLSGATFVAARYKPRWLVVIGGAALVFLGLSLYNVYMGIRGDIRGVVWGGASMSDRIGTTASALEDNWSWFDYQSKTHLETIDSRLNQNFLVGRAYLNVETGSVRLVKGETLYRAVVALVPRILWPGKPTFAGSGDLVSRFTGIHFAAGTSVGIGHVMELYMNFGVPGLVVGFGVIGLCLAFLDDQAGRWLAAGNVERFLLCYVVGQSLLIVIGTFAEIPPCAIGGALLCLAVTRVFFPVSSNSGSQRRQAGKGVGPSLRPGSPR